MTSPTHANAPLSPEGRRRLIERCRIRPIFHVAVEMGIFRATASKWVNGYKRFGKIGLLDRSSSPARQPSATPGYLVQQIESMRRVQIRSSSDIAFELMQVGTPVSRRAITRILAQLGLTRRKFIDPNGETNRDPPRINAKPAGHMVHLDVKKVRRIPDGGGACAWQRQRESPSRRPHEEPRHEDRVYLPAFRHRRTHRLAYTEALPDERAVTAVAFLGRVRVWFAEHGITRIERVVTDNGSCYRSAVFREAVRASRHQRITPSTPRHNGKVERYNRILAEEFLYARMWRSEAERAAALKTLNRHYNYHRPHGAHDGQPPASATPARVNNVMASYN